VTVIFTHILRLQDSISASKITGFCKIAMCLNLLFYCLLFFLALAPFNESCVIFFTEDATNGQ
jgi:hypothetical protein